MKIKTNVFAGMTFEECDAQRNWWKQQAALMEGYATGSSTTPPAGLWFPCSAPPQPSTQGGGYVNGVWYPDMSGTCGGSPTPVYPSGGGYVNGVWYPDKSGSC